MKRVKLLIVLSITVSLISTYLWVNLQVDKKYVTDEQLFRLETNQDSYTQTEYETSLTAAKAADEDIRRKILFLKILMIAGYSLTLILLIYLLKLYTDKIKKTTPNNGSYVKQLLRDRGEK